MQRKCAQTDVTWKQRKRRNIPQSVHLFFDGPSFEIKPRWVASGANELKIKLQPKIHASTRSLSNNRVALYNF